ncbi:hypothetical protein K466DRAFT_460419, partial [Polyporus arcularius HHB13444]
GDLDKGFRELELTKEEWEIAKHLRDVLKLFDDATKFFSRSGTPNLATVIPAIDHMDSKLADYGLDMHLPAAVRAAALLGKQVLNHYYNATDDNVINRAAMVFHPTLKLEYFADAKWPKSWIKDA